MATVGTNTRPSGDGQRQSVASDEALTRAIVGLARAASIEINAQDANLIDAARPLIRAGTRIFVSHLPGQEWAATARACATVRRFGYQPVPHVPVRLLESADALERVLRQLSAQGGASELLMISGDYAQASGPYTDVASALRTDLLPHLGFRRVVFAGHPEGHPKVPLAQIRAAEIDKCRIAASQGLEVSLVTQFLFESGPFLDWATTLRHASIKAHLICGLAGPASLATLLKFAARCGVGQSIRALGSQGAKFRSLLGVQGPEDMLGELAASQAAGTAPFAGVHLFALGGFRRTVEWLARIAEGRIRMTDAGRFELGAP